MADPRETVPPSAPLRPDVVAVTQHDELLLELKEALPGRGRFRPADSATVAVQLMRRNRRAHVLIVDTRGMSDVRGEVEILETQAPHAVILVLVTPDAEAAVAEALQDKAVHAWLPLPIDPGMTAFALESAFPEAIARQPPPDSPIEAPAPPPNSPVDEIPEEPPTLPPPPPVVDFRLIVLLGVLLLGGGGWWYYTHHLIHRRLALQEVETSLLTGRLDDLLEKGRIALRQRRFTSPTGDNALLYYRSALNNDPHNAEALDGLQRVAAVVFTRFSKDISANRLDEAEMALEQLKLAAPGDPRLPALKKQLDVRRAVFARILKDENALKSLSAEVLENIRIGRLIEPEGNDARSALQQLAAAAPGSLLTQRARQALTAAFLRKAQEAVQVLDRRQTDRWLLEAQLNGASGAELDKVRQEFNARTQYQMSAQASAEAERLLGLLRDRLRDGRLTSPEQDSAAFYLTRLQLQQPTHPALAQATRDLADKLLDRARTLIDQDKDAQAEADLAKARSYGADEKQISALESLAARIAAPPPAPPPAPPVSASGSASVAGSSRSLTEPRMLNYVAPTIPQRALDRKVSGSVTLRFTIDVDGSTRDIKVLQANPASFFENAAISAVRRWQYERPVVNGRPAEITVVKELIFNTPDGN